MKYKIPSCSFNSVHLSETTKWLHNQNSFKFDHHVSYNRNMKVRSFQSRQLSMPIICTHSSKLFRCRMA